MFEAQKFACQKRGIGRVRNMYIAYKFESPDPALAGMISSLSSLGPAPPQATTPSVQNVPQVP